jgi:hypothetical protein
LDTTLFTEAAFLLVILCTVGLGLALCEASGWLGARATRRRSEAERRSITLLTQWLSPEQRAQYENSGCFEVSGSHTRKCYRIRSGRQVNIDELGEHGARVAVLCFLPEGPLPVGDVMLAQKIALETDEPGALRAAIRTLDGPGVPYLLPP